MKVEFRKDPSPITEHYKQRVASVFRASKVADRGFFSDNGLFGLVKLGVETRPDEITVMFAPELLEFTYGLDGLRIGNGYATVYGNRTPENEGDSAVPLHTLSPAKVRFVNRFTSFRAKARSSGFVFPREAAWPQRHDNSIAFAKMEIILIRAENGEKPPFFDDYGFIKIEPLKESTRLHIIKFEGLNDLVVINMDSRQLVGHYTDHLLSKKRWEPQSVATRS